MELVSNDEGIAVDVRGGRCGDGGSCGTVVGFVVLMGKEEVEVAEERESSNCGKVEIWVA